MSELEIDGELAPLHQGEGWSTFSVKCHKCDAHTQMDERAMCRAGWDAFIHVSQGNDAWLQTQLCPRHARWWTLRYWCRRFEWRIGRISSWLSPGFSWCFRCKTNWDYVHGHVTHFGDGSGSFPLCEKCWTGLTPTQRLPFYRQLFDRQAAQESERDWNMVETAVLAEEEWPEIVEG